MAHGLIVPVSRKIRKLDTLIEHILFILSNLLSSIKDVSQKYDCVRSHTLCVRPVLPQSRVVRPMPKRCYATPPIYRWSTYLRVCEQQDMMWFTSQLDGEGTWTQFRRSHVRRRNRRTFVSCLSPHPQYARRYLNTPYSYQNTTKTQTILSQLSKEIFLGRTIGLRATRMVCK